jgi:hypothetical protein
LAVLNLCWSSEQIAKDLLTGGQCGRTPPSAKLIGTIYHFWDGQNVVGVQLSEAVTIAAGQVLAIRTKSCFKQVTVSEFQVDENLRLTLKVTGQRSDFPIDSEVFALDKNSFQTSNKLDERHFGRTMVMRLVPPSE